MCIHMYVCIYSFHVQLRAKHGSSIFPWQQLDSPNKMRRRNRGFPEKMPIDDIFLVIYL